uniref:Ribonuclease H-like domain-containing protein n=1 Tax=Tanacetum cinerariifolium TaxID=118510 RepID=A0A6L2L8B2_TANCI|nr:ribonuclease H-like domain-containing protein [Tanacetum cinerariifolium]
MFNLSPNFKLANESQVLLKVPRKNNMYSFDMKNIVPQKDLTCLLAEAINDESMLWHRRLVHVFFLATKDETSRILKRFITEIENPVEKKVKIIRCDNGTNIKNRVMNEFCEEKGIKREYIVARTPRKNKVAERRNRTLIEAARTMLADSKLPTTFWAEAINTACYVQNRVLVVKPHFKTPYELFKGRSPALSFMRPFGCHVTILITLDQLRKFDGKSNEEIFVGYSTISKAFRIYNIRTRKVKENLHITFLENKPTIAGGGPEWLFEIDALSKSMNYAPVPADGHNKDKHGPSQAIKSDNQKRPNAKSSTKTFNTTGPINTATLTYADYPNDHLMPDLEDAEIFNDAYDDRDKGAEDDYNNLETVFSVEPKKVTQALDDESWVEAMQEELLQFKLLNVWTLVDLPHGKEPLEPNGSIETKEVYVSQPLGFVDPEFPDRVYKVEKALYGLYQASRAWYETLATYLLDKRFIRGTFNKTFFIKQIKDDILLVQVYVDDIIFGSTKRSLNKKELAIPGQIETGKELSTPLMAGSLPKTTLPTQLVLNVVSVVQLLLNAAS